MKKAPESERGSRAKKLRRQMRKEARIFRSPVRWILFYAILFSSLLEFVRMFEDGSWRRGVPTPLFAGLALVLVVPAAFGRRKGVRAALSFVLLLIGGILQRESGLVWPGTVILIASVGLVGRALFGPDAAEPKPPPRPER